tara:strand:- start:18949 stop:21108 length:2160 start_codon:yes stop_codon:yes gene_type:complete
MLKKGVFFAVVTICVCSTCYIIKSLSSQNASLSVTDYFSLSDSSVYAINFPNQSSLEDEKIKSIGLNMDLVNSLNKSIPDNSTIYFSKKRGIIIFEANYEWTQSGLIELFRNGMHQIKFLGNRKIQYGAYLGHYAHHILVLYEAKLKLNKGEYEFKIDKKATYSEIVFNDSNHITTNYYRKKDALFSYKNSTRKVDNANNIIDEKVFSKFISSEFDHYQFYEKTYLGTIDSNFKKSPFYKWVNRGVLLLSKENKSLVVLDMKEGQSLLENIGERIGNIDSEENFRVLQNVKLSNFMKASGNESIYVSDLQGFAILSKSKLLFDQFHTEVSLGNSLWMNKLKMQKLYGSLPKAVLHRSHDKNGTQLTVSEVGNQWVTTTFERNNSDESQNDGDVKGYLSMNPREKINSFYAYSGRGNTFIITESNKWIRYENGIRMWEKTFDRKVVKEPKLMEMSTQQNQDISILFKDEALIVDRAGRILNRFPTSGAVHPIRFRLKNNIAFLIPNTNRMNVTDNDGRNISVYNFSSPIVDMVLFKESNRKHVGVLCEKTFFIIDLEQKRTKRKIQLKDTYDLLKFEQYSLILSKNRDHTIDVFGERSSINMPQGFKFKNAFFNGINAELLFSKENELIVINSKGQFIGQKTLGCATIDEIAIYSSDNKPIQIGILDGIENKIVLLDSKNLTEAEEKRRGEKNIQLTNYDHRGISITTFLGDILIQYTKF